jgi:nicotinate-nucleotide pyrophosphorylase
MAISLISPGIKITESDLVSSSQAVSSTSGAFSGQFTWGPIEVATQIANESTLVSYAETGVDYISMGALTHHVKSFDLSLKAVK